MDVGQKAPSMKTVEGRTTRPGTDYRLCDGRTAAASSLSTALGSVLTQTFGTFPVFSDQTTKTQTRHSHHKWQKKQKRVFLLGCWHQQHANCVSVKIHTSKVGRKGCVCTHSPFLHSHFLSAFIRKKPKTT